MAGIHCGQQLADGIVSLLLAEAVRVAITAVSAFGQELFFPPAIDAIGGEI